jgi:hypothetical protein
VHQWRYFENKTRPYPVPHSSLRRSDAPPPRKKGWKRGANLNCTIGERERERRRRLQQWRDDHSYWAFFSCACLCGGRSFSRGGSGTVVAGHAGMHRYDRDRMSAWGSRKREREKKRERKKHARAAAGRISQTDIEKAKRLEMVLLVANVSIHSGLRFPPKYTGCERRHSGNKQNKGGHTRYVKCWWQGYK